jgi:hypothetical protein
VSETVGLLAAICVLAHVLHAIIDEVRAFAIVSNLLFIVYASADLLPILLLHTVLLPINGWSLVESLVVVQLQS